MPSSDYRQIPIVVQTYWEFHPESILDIGCGWGKYGFLAREYLRDCPWMGTGWKTVKRVDAVEVFENYITDLQRKIYDNIYIGDITELEVGEYDLILLVDVIEHIEKTKALELVAKLKKKGRLLIITPSEFCVHPPRYGNKHEEHISHFTYEDFGGRNMSTPESLIVLIDKE